MSCLKTRPSQSVYILERPLTMAAERKPSVDDIHSLVQTSANHLKKKIKEHFCEEARHIHEAAGEVHTLNLKCAMSLSYNDNQVKDVDIINFSETIKKEDMEDEKDSKMIHFQIKPSEEETMLHEDAPRKTELTAMDRQLFEHVTSLGQLELMRKYAPCHPFPQPDGSSLNKGDQESYRSPNIQPTESRNNQLLKTTFKTNEEGIYSGHDSSLTKIKDEDSRDSQNGLPSASIIPLKKTVKAASETDEENQNDDMGYQVVRIPSSDDDYEGNEGINSDATGNCGEFTNENEVKDEPISDVDYEPGLTDYDSDDRQTLSKRKRRKSDSKSKKSQNKRKMPRTRKETAKRVVPNRGRRTVAKLALKVKMKQLNKTKPKLKKPVRTNMKEESEETKEKRKQLASSIDEANLACLLCNKTFDTKRAFRRHTNRHWSNFQCDQCGKNFSSIDSLSHHTRGLHSTIKPYSCEECGQFFNFHHSYKLHMRKHRGERPYQCDMCDKSYLTGTHLKAHKQAIHHCGNKRKFTCDICGKEFNYNNSLKTHNMIHLNDRPHKCSMCKKGFVTRQALKAHEESYHVSEKNFQCDICFKFYKSAHLRNVHHRRHTDDVNRFMCDICGRQFMFKSNLDAHVFVHMDSRPFTCKLCGKNFKCMSSLYTHQYTHKSDTPYQCRVCAKTFKTKNCCKAHEKRHNPEKTFVCHTCGSCFPDKGGLSKHIRTIHAPARQFVCKFCGKTGTRADNMRTHIKSHGKDLTPEELQNCISEVAMIESTEKEISTQMTINSALQFNPMSKPTSPPRKYLSQNPSSLSTQSPVTAHQQLHSPVSESISETTGLHTSTLHHEMTMMRPASTEMTPHSHLQTHSIIPTDLAHLRASHLPVMSMTQSQNSIPQNMTIQNQVHMSLNPMAVQYGGATDLSPGSSQVHVMSHEHSPGSTHHPQMMSHEQSPGPTQQVHMSHEQSPGSTHQVHLSQEHSHHMLGDGNQYL